MSNMKIRIYYEDTDCGGVVYHANYLRYMERSRTEVLREAGIDFAEYHQKGCIFAITEVHTQYRFPAVYNDLLTVETEIIAVTSFTITFRTFIRNESGKLCCRGTVKMVAVNSAAQTAMRIPEEIFTIANACIVV